MSSPITTSSIEDELTSGPSSMLRPWHTNARGKWARNITRIGWFLIYTRIVSLPQLINVIRGDITLVEMHDNSSSFWA